MKRIVCITVLALLVCSLFLIGCTDNRQTISDDTDDITSGAQNIVPPPRPEDTTLDFWLTEELSQQQMDSLDEITGIIGAREFLGKDYKALSGENNQFYKPEIYVSYIVGSWPDEKNFGHFVTTIEITDPKITLYGISCQSPYEDFDSVFTEMGYDVEKYETYHIAKSERFSFVMVKTSKEKLIARAIVTNVDNIQY